MRGCDKSGCRSACEFRSSRTSTFTATRSLGRRCPPYRFTTDAIFQDPSLRLHARLPLAYRSDSYSPVLVRGIHLGYRGAHSLVGEYLLALTVNFCARRARYITQKRALL